ncbi:MAG: ParA family protein [Gammaproteobacteria bacterium]|nr:ParA family protein [Gammaproteobacteria bacterium]
MTGHIVTVAQQKGGSGKTTVSAHLAVAWSLRPDCRVAILDVDPQGSLGEWYERREQRLGEDHTGLTFRTASGWGARRESRALARDHDLVVVDTPPHADSDARNAMELATLVVVPVQPTPADLWATDATLLLAEKERIPALLVLNRVPPRARLTEEIEAVLGQARAPLTRSRLGNRVAFAQSLGAGATVLETHRSGSAARELLDLHAELRRSMGDEPD